MKKVIVIVGPTAVGKTDLSIAIASKINAEIISGDSMQIYKGMDIGTGKITPEETLGIPHYMINIMNPNIPFSVAEFTSYVRNYIDAIHNNNKIPIIVGGSGLYIQAILYNYTFSERKTDKTITNDLEKILLEEGIDPLYKRLQHIDPVQAEKIHPNNYRRVIRALEIYETTGLTMSEWHAKQERTNLYDEYVIGLEMDRPILYDRINKRVDQMISDGLVEEVQALINKGYEHTQAMQAIGYKELIPYIKGDESLETCIHLLKRNSRRYAKRQYTWFKNQMLVNWFQVDNHQDVVYENILRHVNQFLFNKTE